MKLSYKIFIASIIIMVLTLGASIYLSFWVIPFRECPIASFVNNILLNVFAGAVILFFTTIFEYNHHKTQDIKNIKKYILEYRNEFNNLKYVEKLDLPSCIEYKKMKKIKEKNIEDHIKYSKEYNDYIKSQIKDFDNIINAYINISRINTNGFRDIHDDLRFILFNKSKMKKLENNIFDFVTEEIILIRQLAYHLNEYKNANDGNTITIYGLLRDYQSKIFYENIRNDNKLTDEEVKLIDEGISYQMISKDNEFNFIYNKFIKHLDDNYDIKKLLNHKND